MPDDDFAHTLALARQGDAAAFGQLWRELQPKLLRYLGVVAPAGQAEDVASETWLQVVSGLAGFTGGAREFQAWLFTVARHRAIDEARRSARRPQVPLADSEPAGAPLAPDAADEALQRISTERALALIATLPADQAEIVTLRVIAGLDAESVARLVGRSPGAVRVAAHRALRTLAATLSARESERQAVT